MLAQEADVVFGQPPPGTSCTSWCRRAPSLILFTGGNTSFSGFPFLTSFVAEDSFLPRWLTKRGHRLALSNGIIVLTVVSLALLFAVGANVNGLVPFYAIGVFTGFSMAGFGMVRYHQRATEPGWRRRLIINLTGGIYTALVVVIFAVVKFTEGAWLIVIVFPIGVFRSSGSTGSTGLKSEVLENIGDAPGLRHPAAAAELQPPGRARSSSTTSTSPPSPRIRYARGLRPTTVRAVHFVIDSAQAERLRANWLRTGRTSRSR